MTAGAAGIRAAADGRAAARRVVLAPDPVLSSPAAAVALPDPAVSALVDNLLATMAAHRGLGLSAPQLGVPLRVAVVQAAGQRLALINPRLLRSRGRQTGWEGCLSVPDRVAEVERPADVVVESLGLDGRSVRLRLRGLAARAVVHELDHLDGRLYTSLVPAGALVDTVAHPTPPARRGGQR